MQTRSIRGSGEPAWVSASLNACLRLGSDPRRAWPAATSAAQTGRTHDRTRPMLHGVEKALANQAPSKHNLCLNSHPAKCSRRYCSALRNWGVPPIWASSQFRKRLPFTASSGSIWGIPGKRIPPKPGFRPVPSPIGRVRGHGTGDEVRP